MTRVTPSSPCSTRNAPRGYGWVGGPPAWWSDGAWCEQDDPRRRYHCERCGACLPPEAGLAGRAQGESGLGWQAGSAALAVVVVARVVLLAPRAVRPPSDWPPTF